VGFLLCCCKKKNTFCQWASEIGTLKGQSLSKQALFERTTAAAASFASMLLQHVIRRQLRLKSEVFKGFNKVLLQDSTTLKLPDKLASYFPGNITKGIQKAIARIQCVMNLQTLEFLQFSLKSFRDNDQSASADVLNILSKGDLLIRDLGYFSLKTFKRIISRQAYFLSRLRFGVKLYDVSGQPLDWKVLLKSRKTIDKMVLIGKKEKIPMRLVMLPLPAGQTAARVRKARRDRDGRLNHSKQYYQWLGYSVFITNVSEEVWTSHHVQAAYKTRWQIEIIFKSWKSGFNLQHILHDGCTNGNRVKLNIYLLLLFICLFMQKIYIPYKEAIENQNNKTLSLIKLSAYVCFNLIAVVTLPPRQLKEELIRHCCYEKRNDRINMTDLIKYFKN